MAALSANWLTQSCFLYILLSVFVTRTFDDNLRIKDYITKYLNESCWICSESHFFIKYFPNIAFAFKILLRNYHYLVQSYQIMCALQIQMGKLINTQRSLECFVCYSHTFENNLGIKQKLAKYLNESCYLTSDQHFSFSRKCFCK